MSAGVVAVSIAKRDESKESYPSCVWMGSSALFRILERYLIRLSVGNLVSVPGGNNDAKFEFLLVAKAKQRARDSAGAVPL